MNAVGVVDDARRAGLTGGRRVYAYRVRRRGRGRGGVVLWAPGRGDDLDRVLAVREAGRTYVPLFATARQARMYVRRRGGRLATPGAATLDLGRVQHWLEAPTRRRAPRNAVLEAWNFFEDLARGLDATDRLPQRTAPQDSAYEKLFGAEEESLGWSADEEHAVLELLRAGAELWTTCPVVRGPAHDHKARGLRLSPLEQGFRSK